MRIICEELLYQFEISIKIKCYEYLWQGRNGEDGDNVIAGG